MKYELTITDIHGTRIEPYDSLAKAGRAIMVLEGQGSTIESLTEIEEVAEDTDWLDNFNYVGSRHHY